MVLGKHTQKLHNKKTQPVKWSTQGSDFLTTYKTNVKWIQLELNVTKSVTWNFHVDDLQKNWWYVMIIGPDLFSKLQLDLCFSEHIIMGNGGAYEKCTVSMKYPSDLRDDSSFRDGEWWESEHTLNATRCTRRILDAKYKKSDLSNIVSDSKHLSNDEQSMLYDVITKYEWLLEEL